MLLWYDAHPETTEKALCMIKKLKKAWAAFRAPEEPPAKPRKHYLSDTDVSSLDKEIVQALAYERVYQRQAKDHLAPEVTSSLKLAMDSADLGAKSMYQYYQNTVPTVLLTWYASQSFIGYQTCEYIAQHWLVDKACSMPCDDAARNGYEITVNDGVSDIKPDVLDAIKKADEKYRLNYHMVEFARKNRVFGIRIAMFDMQGVEYNDDYYLKPFNIDSVKPKSYKGIIQIDPYWVTPELDFEAAANPASQYFYEPTWWRVNSRRIHRTHLIIIRNSEVGDLLKPTYFYGGVSIPQKMFERVYAAERCANEAPQLLLTKRSGVLSTDAAAALANEGNFRRKLEQQNFLRDNYSTRVIDKENEAYNQFDTALADVDTAIMTQYQICSGIAGVPITKLLGTSLKGFMASGEFEESNYHENLKGIQTHNFSPLLQRHHELLIRSEIMVEFNIPLFEVTHVWKPLDSTTTKGKAENNKLKAEADAALVGAGILSPDEPRKRLANDEDSGYNGLISEELTEPDPLEEGNLENAGNPANELTNATPKAAISI